VGFPKNREIKSTRKVSLCTNTWNKRNKKRYTQLFTLKGLRARYFLINFYDFMFTLILFTLLLLEKKNYLRITWIIVFRKRSIANLNPREILSKVYLCNISKKIRKSWNYILSSTFERLSAVLRAFRTKKFLRRPTMAVILEYPIQISSMKFQNIFKKQLDVSLWEVLIPKT